MPRAQGQVVGQFEMRRVKKKPSKEPLQSPRVPLRLDKGIEQSVMLLREHDVETFESCEGGPGHAYPEPTIAFHGAPEVGWRALSVCLAHGLPVAELRRVWNVLDGHEPTGPHWHIVFNQRPG